MQIKELRVKRRKNEPVFGVDEPKKRPNEGKKGATKLNLGLEKSGTFDAVQITAVLAGTAPVAARGEFEPFRTTTDFDGTAHNPQ